MSGPNPERRNLYQVLSARGDPPLSTEHIAGILNWACWKVEPEDLLSQRSA